MGFSLNSAVKPQTTELNKRAKIHSNESSPTKRLYVDGENKRFSREDIIVLIRNVGKIYRTPLSMMKAVKLIKADKPGINEQLTKENFEDFKNLMDSLGVDDYGFFEVTPERLFKGCGVPHKYGLVFSSGMDAQYFKSAPSMACQLEVARVYSQTGDIANRVASFLQNKGFGASPNHSMGGQLDYSMAAEWAGVAVTGKHSMAITKKNGPCNRISVVYTDIENLSDYMPVSNDDMLWINDFCQKCGKCVRTCPQKAIYSESVVIDGTNPTKIDYEKCAKGFVNYGCGICIKECPFTGGHYEKLEKAFSKANQKKSGERLKWKLRNMGKCLDQFLLM